MKARRIISIVFVILSVLLLVLCFAELVLELLAGAVLKAVEQPHDIDYMNLTVSFGWITLTVFAGILLSWAATKLCGTRRAALAGKILVICFAACPIFFLFCQ